MKINLYSVKLSEEEENTANSKLAEAKENGSWLPSNRNLWEATKDLQRIGFDTQSGPKYPPSHFPWTDDVIYKHLLLFWFAKYFKDKNCATFKFRDTLDSPLKKPRPFQLSGAPLYAALEMLIFYSKVIY